MHINLDHYRTTGLTCTGAELVIIPTGLSRLAGQAIRLLRRIRLS
jgi:hypothetical protein